MTGSPGPDVLAAGALVWRRAADGGLAVLLVHSHRYDEWTWPKGKPEGAEPLPVTAVREVAEESGVSIRLGRPLPAVEYTLPDGRGKRVSFWAARPVADGPRTADEDEIDDAVWLDVGTAREALSRPADLLPLRRLVELADSGVLETRVLLTLRHAKAHPRKGWKGDDADRPLTEAGREQALQLIPLIGCWRPERVVTSPWARCHDTVSPYARCTGTPLTDEPALTQATAERDPAAVAVAVRAELPAPDDALVCTHRPVLATVVGELRSAAARDVRRGLPRSDPWLAKGELLVSHASRDGGTLRIDAVERFRVDADWTPPSSVRMVE